MLIASHRIIIMPCCISRRSMTMRTRLVHALAILLSCCHYGSCGWVFFMTKWQESALLALRGGERHSDSPPISEVVGASGRMGSLWLRQEASIAVPRGVSPGCLSINKSPIYVTTPSKCWCQVYRETLETRRTDLVFVGNGLLLPEFVNSTIVIPHYGILSVGSKPVTLPSSPPTFVYGRHSKQVAEILQREGIQTQIVASWRDIQIQAAQKLLWASCLWLLCHSSEPSLTVEQIHIEHYTALEDLVTELLPALEHIVGTSIDRNDILAYLEAFSRSVSGAIPNKDLAMEEVKERNGVWLQLRSQFPQPLHEELLVKVAGSEILDKALEKSLSSTVERHSVGIKDIDLTVWGVQNPKQAHRKAVVIGCGIVGSSVALNLARCGANVTVLDRQTETQLGVTTPASWAWINANNKSPPAYQWLNQLGMRSWRKDSVIHYLPVWSGALVQYKECPLFHGGYAREGPLSTDRLRELEPLSNFSYADGPVYFFPNEGSVDPAAAVRSMREAAKNLGVQLIPNHNVTSLLRNANGDINGVVSQSLITGETTATPADVVIVTAGIGSASPALGGLPLTYSPGQIVFAKSLDSSQSLKRILVDTVRESHVLQRQDGTLVAGGGFLEVGGTPSSEKGSRYIPIDDRGIELLSGAMQLAPRPVDCCEFTHTASAVRPMPQDGWPAVGYLEPGLYTIVTHSGVTLSPVLGPLAATEIAYGLDLDILQPFRPTRFFDNHNAAS